jgi:hypothetical protein
MKKTDLEKHNALKIQGRMKGAGTPARFAGGSSGERRGAALNPLIEKLLKKGLADTDPA